MNKPVFLWWAHKMMWDMLVKNPTMTKAEAMEELQDMYPSIATPKCLCFACEAQKYYGKCHTERCPLDWHIGWHAAPKKTYGCDCEIDTQHDGLHRQYINAKHAECYGLAKGIAKKIRDLSLRENANELYDIKESPDD